MEGALRQRQHYWRRWEAWGRKHSFGEWDAWHNTNP